MFSSNTKEESGEKNNKNLFEILSENKESTTNNSIKEEGGEKNGKNLFEGLGNRNIRVDECLERIRLSFWILIFLTRL
ncbi:unnamed protein product [Rhizophagus irregularis]|nr:unnamed protein product [Rhizophagus irregularis]